MAEQNLPPWMQGKKKKADDPMAMARKSVAQKRLAKLKTGGVGGTKTPGK